MRNLAIFGMLSLLGLGVSCGGEDCDDGIDNDDDGLVDCEDPDCDACDPDTAEGDTDTETDLVDEDGDGFYSETSGGDDCDDSDPAINPDAEETCNDLDDDCDGNIDYDIVGLKFASTGDSVLIPNDSSMDLGETATMELWANLQSTREGWLLSKWAYGDENKYLKIRNDGSVEGGCYIGGGTNTYSAESSQILPTNRWVHVAVSWDSGTTMIFLDGNLAGSASRDPSGYGCLDSTADLIVGNSVQNDRDMEPIDGFISQVRLSSVVRYDASFTPSSEFEIDAETIGYWKMTEGSGDQVFDHSASSNNGTLSGAQWQDVSCL